MRRVGFYYDDVFLAHHTPLWHPETPSRLVNLVKSIKESGIWDKIIHLKPKRASFEEIALVHTAQHIERIKNAKVGYLDPDTYFSEGSLEAALHAVGAVTSAIDEIKAGVIERAFCAVRPPGHHAEAHKAMGFCLFNNIAIGVRYAQRLGYHRVFIIDFDVHHGNGTQNVFYKDNTVFFFSTHQYPHYPGTGSEDEIGIDEGEGFTYNIPNSCWCR
ncbi:MAG: histone deacetylase [Thermodesulfovibrionales bacterium]